MRNRPRRACFGNLRSGRESLAPHWGPAGAGRSPYCPRAHPIIDDITNIAGRRVEFKGNCNLGSATPSSGSRSDGRTSNGIFCRIVSRSAVHQALAKLRQVRRHGHGNRNNDDHVGGLPPMRRPLPRRRDPTRRLCIPPFHALRHTGHVDPEPVNGGPKKIVGSFRAHP